MSASRRMASAWVFAAAFLVPSRAGAAETTPDYPTRPIRIVVPFSAGSAADLLARRIAVKMSESWNQQVVVDNRGGAGGVVGVGLVAAAPPNGYTLLVHSLAMAVSTAMYSKLPYDSFRREVARIVQLPDVVKQMVSQGEQPRSSTPEEFTAFFRAEVERYRRIVKLANIRVE